MSITAAHPSDAMKRQMRIGVSLSAAIMVAWLAIHITGIFFWQWSLATLPIAILMVLVQTWLSTGLFIVAHDSMHGALAPEHPRLNRAIGATCLSLYACLSYASLLPQHHLHHKQTGRAGDPDFHGGDPRLTRWFLQFFKTYYSHGQIIRITLVALVYTLLLGAPLGNIVIFWALPALGAVAQLFVFGTWLPHRERDLPFADTHRAHSLDIGPALSLMTCFHFGGYHHEHHLSPGTPWWGLPARRRALAVRAADRRGVEDPA
ncbi:fatty acid desaturase [Sphingomonas aerolata]|uniref:Beta-carotene ketolase (CrtW type) n=1 Tax=Sphingomonas aerolata TaxID=185951 RepID=A0A2T4YUL4_9SPHN|nr:fatty acid desaturase [Sphingomonas aerolata]PTM47487.1 beta-carotene ketolase (CrtW type) [Sphingomonas aerolata]